MKLTNQHKLKILAKYYHGIFLFSQYKSAADPVVPIEKNNPKGRGLCANLLFGQLFSENCMQLKKIGSRWGTRQKLAANAKIQNMSEIMKSVPPFEISKINPKHSYFFAPSPVLVKAQWLLDAICPKIYNKLVSVVRHCNAWRSIGFN